MTPGTADRPSPHSPSANKMRGSPRAPHAAWAAAARLAACGKRQPQYENLDGIAHTLEDLAHDGAAPPRPELMGARCAESAALTEHQTARPAGRQ
jgi:hypothetical protein